MRLPSVEVSWQSLFPKPSQSCLRHFDQEERESDGSRHWEAIKSVLLGKFVRDESQDFSDEVWLQRIFKGSSKKRIEYCKKQKMESCVILRAIQRQSGGIPTETELMGYVKIPPNWKRYIFHKGTFMEFSVHIGKGTDSRRKGEMKARQAVFPTPTNHFWKSPGRRTSSWSHRSRESTLRKLVGNTTRMHCTGYDCQRRRIKDWNSGKTKSCAIMTYATIRDWRTIFFERLENSKASWSNGWIGKASRSSSSIPLLAQTYLASWRRRQ